MFNSRILKRIQNSIVWGIILLAISFGASLTLLYFEGNIANNKELDQISELSFWWVQTVTGLGAPVQLITFEARLIAVFIILSGFILFGLFVSEFAEIFRMVYSRYDEGNIKISYKNHIVIFGYTSLTAGVIKMVRRHFGMQTKIVLISNDVDSNPFPGQVDFMHDNPINKETLVDANISEATAAIILANDRFRDPDTYSLVIASGIELNNSRVVTIVEIVDAINRNYFKKIHIDAFINRDELLRDLLENNPNPKLKRIIAKESVLEENLTEAIRPELI